MQLFLICLIITLTEQNQCPSFYFFNQFEILFSKLQNQDTSIINEINNYSDPHQAIANPNPQLCPQFSKSSCCSQSFEQTLLNISQIYYFDVSERDFPFTKIIKSLQQSINNCGIRDQASFELIEDANIPKLKQAIQKYRQLVAQLIYYNLKLIRSNLCILCMPQQQSSEFILNQKLIVNQALFEQYISEMSIVFQNLQGLVPIFKTQLSLYFTNYADTTKCASILFKLTEYMDNLQFCIGDNCTYYIQQRVNIFIQEMVEELIYIPYPDFGFNSQKINSNRVLSQLDSYSVSADKGLLTYQELNVNEGSQISYQGMSAKINALISKIQKIELILALIYIFQ